jgi:hypothetical protein
MVRGRCGTDAWSWKSRWNDILIRIKVRENRERYSNREVGGGGGEGDGS